MGPFFRKSYRKMTKGVSQSRGVGLLLGGKIPLFWHILVRNETLFRRGGIPFHRSSLRIWHLVREFSYLPYLVNMAIDPLREELIGLRSDNRAEISISTTAG
jgi:hypothetical protein